MKEVRGVSAGTAPGHSTGPRAGAADDRAALSDLFDHHFDAVYRFCLARCGDPATADDAASEAFLAAARTFARGRGSDVDRPWLFVTARRRLVDQWRASRRHLRRVERLAAEPGAAVSDPGDAAPVDTDRVLDALASLPDRQRAAITLRYLDEFSVAEIADSLGVDYRAAESLLARGRRGFGRAWEEGEGHG